jgi:hypothetical protein
MSQRTQRRRTRQSSLEGFDDSGYTLFLVDETYTTDFGEAIADVTESQVNLIDKEY